MESLSPSLDAVLTLGNVAQPFAAHMPSPGPLSQCRRGERVVVERLTGPHEVQGRLESVGVYPGQRLRVFRSSRSGAMVIDGDDMRLALDRRLAERVVVRYL